MDDGPAGYVVTVDSGDRVHFLDWGDPAGGRPGVLLVHGLSQTAWIWAPVARPLAQRVATVAMDLRGHGLSDAPTEDGAYDLSILASDVVAVAEGSGLLDERSPNVVVVGHGFGAIVAAQAAAALGGRCAALILVDGGWESIEHAVGMEADEFLRGLDEPPEVMRSMRAYLADRRAFDPSTWDADQEAAARAAVVETHAGRVVPATRPHALEACVRSMFNYDPAATMPEIAAPVVAFVAGGPDEDRDGALGRISAARVTAGRGAIERVRFDGIGHNVMRYRPAQVVEEILGLVGRAAEAAI